MGPIFDLNKIDWENSLKGFGHSYSKGIKCPYCNAFSTMFWKYALGFDSTQTNKYVIHVTVISATCLACNCTSYWLTSSDQEIVPEQLIYPKSIKTGPNPNPDMPNDVKDIFNEARKVLNDSPRASAALSRLAIDKLTQNLTGSNKGLNDRIGTLVKNGLPVKIQQSLDIVRVVGNNAVHPGTLDLKDNKEMALSLLELINLIVDNQISQSKKIQNMYNNLPESSKEAIKARDQKNNN